jgi:hypothetical protein
MLHGFRCLFVHLRWVDILMLIAEFLILAFIVGEAAIGLYHWHVRRSATLELQGLLVRGLDLYSHPPPAQATQQEALIWIEKAKRWIENVQTFLDKKSKAALVVFNYVSVNSRIFPQASFHVALMFPELDARLKTLRSIMEKPDVYF